MQGNVCSCPKNVQDASRTHVRRIRNMREAHSECSWDASMQAQNLVIKLQQNLSNCHALFARHGTHPENMQDASGMHVRHILDAFECYLAFEPYRMLPFLHTNILDILNVLHTYICTLVDIFYYTCSSDQQSPILSGFPTSLKEAQSQIFSIFFLRSRFSGEVKGALDLNSLLGTTSKGQQFWALICKFIVFV